MNENQHLIFEVGEEYALELERVEVILEYQPVTFVPETPPYIPGVINLRGHVVPVIDLRARFHKEPKPVDYKTCIIIINTDGHPLGLIADYVSGLLEIPPDKIVAPPQVGHDYAYNFVRAIGVLDEKMKLIVDVDKLVNFSDLEFLSGKNAE